MASLVHKENLKEAQHVMPEVRTTRDRAIEIQRTPSAGYKTNPGDLEGGEGIRALDTNTTMEHFSWIFPIRLQHVAALTQRIGSLVPLWKKERGMGAARGRFDELDQLQADLQDQLAGTEEDWDEVKTSDDWSQTDAVKEKKVITRMVRNSRSWGREVLRKIEDFRVEEVKWRRHDNATTSQYQE
jgi:hypothetical protein